MLALFKIMTQRQRQRFIPHKSSNADPQPSVAPCCVILPGLPQSFQWPAKPQTQCQTATPAECDAQNSSGNYAIWPENRSNDSDEQPERVCWCIEGCQGEQSRVNRAPCKLGMPCCLDILIAPAAQRACLHTAAQRQKVRRMYWHKDSFPNSWADDCRPELKRYGIKTVQHACAADDLAAV